MSTSPQQPEANPFPVISLASYFLCWLFLLLVTSLVGYFPCWLFLLLDLLSGICFFFVCFTFRYHMNGTSSSVTIIHKNRTSACCCGLCIWPHCRLRTPSRHNYFMASMDLGETNFVRWRPDNLRRFLVGQCDTNITPIGCRFINQIWLYHHSSGSRSNAVAS